MSIAYAGGRAIVTIPSAPTVTIRIDDIEEDGLSAADVDLVTPL
ncbi:MAG: hypothetical protein AAFW46_17470 [Pseudomonadota bacterium]